LSGIVAGYGAVAVARMQRIKNDDGCRPYKRTNTRFSPQQPTLTQLQTLSL